jgi:hypothetical protein
MSFQTDVERVGSLMHTLATAEVINNTFGMVTGIERGLGSILAQLQVEAATGRLNRESAASLRELAVRIEDSRLLFGIPETWLIDRVVANAVSLRKRLDQLFPPS